MIDTAGHDADRSAWLVGAGAGVLLFDLSRRTEPEHAVRLAGLFALATGFTLAAAF